MSSANQCYIILLPKILQLKHNCSSSLFLFRLPHPIIHASWLFQIHDLFFHIFILSIYREIYNPKYNPLSLCNVTSKLQVDSQLVCASVGKMSLVPNISQMPIVQCLLLRIYGLFPVHFGMFIRII